MKRSEAINILQHKVCCPHEIITRDMYDSGVYYDRAKRLLDFIEKELGMMPPPQETFTVSTLSGEALGELDGTYEWESEDETK